MSDNIVKIVKEHRAFYEVSPYYVMLEERHGSLKGTTRKVQGGFDVDIYGINTRKDLTFPGSDRDYVLGYSELQKIAEDVSHHTSGSCVLEVFSFPWKIVFDNRNRETVAGMLQIRISHGRGLNQPASLPEEHALKEVETQLHGLGVTRR